LIPATQWVKVYKANEDYKTLSVGATTPAIEIISLALDKMRINSTPDQFVLCEVKTNGAIREFKDDEISLLSQMSRNGRLYLKEKNKPETKLPPPPIPERPQNVQNLLLGFYFILFYFILFYLSQYYQ